LSLPNRLPAPERRQAILQAAVHLFARNGFSGTTTRELSQAVGVSEPVLYQHFPSKSDLYKAIIENLMEQVNLVAWPDPGLPVDEFFQQLATGILDFHAKNADYLRILLYSGLEKHELSRMFHERHACQVFDALSQRLRQRIEEGSLRPDLDPALTARAFVSMIGDVGLKQLIITEGECGISGGVDREQLVQHMIKIFVNGVKKQ